MGAFPFSPEAVADEAIRRLGASTAGSNASVRAELISLLRSSLQGLGDFSQQVKRLEQAIDGLLAAHVEATAARNDILRAELIKTIEEALRSIDVRPPDIAALRARSRALGFDGPGDSTALIRSARDARRCS